MQWNAGCRAYDNVKAAGTVAGLSGAEPGSCVLEVANITNIALVFGFSIFVLVYATAAYTGRHLSPIDLYASILSFSWERHFCAYQSPACCTFAHGTWRRVGTRQHLQGLDSYCDITRLALLLRFSSVVLIYATAAYTHISFALLFTQYSCCTLQ